MIPHHDNAINMGKSLLKLHDERDDWDELSIIIHSLINWQTQQVAFMREFLAEAGAPSPEAARSCPSPAPVPSPAAPAPSAGTSAARRAGRQGPALLVAVVLCVGL